MKKENRTLMAFCYSQICKQKKETNTITVKKYCDRCPDCGSYLKWEWRDISSPILKTISAKLKFSQARITT